MPEDDELIPLPDDDADLEPEPAILPAMPERSEQAAVPERSEEAAAPIVSQQTAPASLDQREPHEDQPAFQAFATEETRRLEPASGESRGRGPDSSRSTGGKARSPMAGIIARIERLENWVKSNRLE